MSAHTLLISDLHLDDARPGATDLFLAFVTARAARADALYILGDLFEYWLGDDVRTPLSERVADGLSQLVDAGVPCYFMHGNRDFLLGPEYAELCGMQLLPEEIIVDLYGCPTLLMHGDQLCTDDAEYQQVRLQVRDPAWQAEFMARTPADRVAFAREARQQSEQYKQGASEDIMDVNGDAVASAFTRHDVHRLIHGHTHRPAIHDLSLPSGRAQRIVLGDWYAQGSLLRVSASGVELAEFASV